MTRSETVAKESFPVSLRLKSKWGSPRITNAFARQRLFDQLDRSADRQCTWLVAPGGYGKTYLLQSYIAVGRRPALWYNLDEGDTDVAAFFADFGAALTMGGLGPMVPLSPDVQSLSRFGRLYFQQLGGQLEEQKLLVFDDYHRVGADSGLHKALAAALGHLPASLRLIVLSREAPSPAFARAQSHRQIDLIGSDDLVLTEEEATGIAGLSTIKRLGNQAIVEACQRAGGWAAGFMVLLGQSNPSVITPESAETLFNYFEYEVLNTAPEDTRAFLWQTALFPTMNAGMAERLTGRKDAAAMLRGLAGGNYFLYAGQSPEPVYYYHDLFRDYLVEHGRTRHANEWQQAARRAADILSESGEPDAAAELYAEISHWAGLGQLVNSHGPGLMRRGSYRTLERWLALFPPALKEQQPWLLFWDGCSRLVNDPKQARERLQRAFALFSAGGETIGALLAWAATCQAYWFVFDDMRPLAAWLDELDTLWPGPHSGLPEEVEGHVALGAFMCLMLVRPDDPALADWENLLTRLLESGRSPDLTAMAVTFLAMHSVWTMGDRGRTIMLRDTLRAVERSQAAAPMNLIAAHNAVDFVCEYAFGDRSPAQSVESLHDTVREAAQRGVHYYDIMLYGLIASTQLAAGNLDEARPVLDRMGEILNWEMSYDAAHYLWLRSWEAWLSGRHNEALEIARKMHRYAERLGLLHPRAMQYLALAQTANSVGRRAEALRHLADIGLWTRRTKGRIGPYIRGLGLAKFALQRGQQRRTRRILRITLSLAADTGYLVRPFFRPQDLTALYAEALSAGIQPEYCRRFIRSRELPAPRTMESAERWPWRVRVYALGEFRLELDQHAYANAGKAQQKPLELLKALMALGGDAVPQEQLADLLWPDADGDVAASNFKTTLNRLRKLLGAGDFLLLREGALSLNHEYGWSDVWRFTELAREIEVIATPNGDLPRLPMVESLAERLAAAYPRPLLCGGREEWIPAVRRRLHGRYSRCIENLARLMERGGVHEMAADLRASAVILEDDDCL